MNSQDTRGAGSLPDTHWTTIIRPLRTDDDQGRAAFGKLYEIYRAPVLAAVRRWGHDEHRAEDLVHDFFERLLSKNPFGSVSPEKGRFRDWLLAALRNFLRNEYDKRQAQRRGGGQIPIHLDDAPEVAGGEAPDRLLLRDWANACVQESFKRLQSSYEQRRKVEHFQRLKEFLPGGTPSISRSELAASLGITTNAVDQEVRRLKEQFGIILHRLVADTVPPDQVDEEIRLLIDALGT